MRHTFCLASFACVSLALLVGCGTTQTRGDSSRPDASRAAQPANSPTAALVANKPLSTAALTPALFEAAGAVVLEEAALDVLLEDALANASITLDAQRIEAEQTMLLEQIARESQVSADDATRLLAQLRAARGLGAVRFASQLRRTAALRALVQQNALVTPEQIEQERAILNSQRLRVRLIVTASQNSAQEARNELLSVQALQDRIARAAMIAQRISTDASAASGGLIESMSTADPAVPAALRTSLASLQAGEVSPVIALDRGFALGLVEAQLPMQQYTLEEATQRATTRVERIAMDALASRILASANITPLDQSLTWSWNAANQR
jgi:hypothetical protein